MIRIYRWNPETDRGTWHDADLLRTPGNALTNSSEILWIDLETPTEDEESLVFHHFFAIHSLSLEDITRPRRLKGEPPHLPKVEEFPDYLFVIVNPLVNGLLDNMRVLSDQESEDVFVNGSPVTQISAVLTHTILITHHYAPTHAVDELRGFLSKHETAAARGPDYLFHLILDEMVDEYAPVLDHFGDLLEGYEIQIFDQPSRLMLRRMIACKRAIIALRKTLVHEREILARLCRGEFALIDERETVYYRNVYDHLIRFAELTEASREMVSDLLQMHLAASSNRLNEVMKVLAMISTIVLPMTLIAGIYGMNFDRLIPDIKTYYGFEITLGMMLLSGIGSLLLFRWKKWL